MRKIRTIIGTVLCAMVLALGNRMPVMAEEVVAEELKAADTLNLTVSYPSDIKCGEEASGDRRERYLQIPDCFTDGRAAEFCL